MVRNRILAGSFPVLGSLALAAWVVSVDAGQAAAAVGASPRADTIRLVDDEGYELRLEAPARRIVSLVPAVTELAFAIGAGGRLVGRTRYATYPEAARAIPDVGEGIRPSLELVLARDPDLVVLFSGPDNQGVTEALRRAGVRVLSLRHNSLQDLERNLDRLGAITGCSEQARELADWIARGLRSVREATRRLERRSVYFEAWAEPPITIGAGSYLDSLISLAGGHNVFGDLAAASPRVSLEAIAVRRPDLMIVPVADRRPFSNPKNRVGWTVIPAVAEGRVRRLDADLLSRLGPRVVAATVSLAMAVQPEAKDLLDLVEETPPSLQCR